VYCMFLVVYSKAGRYASGGTKAKGVALAVTYNSYRGMSGYNTRQDADTAYQSPSFELDPRGILHIFL
jgi:hypothetical protein